MYFQQRVGYFIDDDLNRLLGRVFKGIFQTLSLRKADHIIVASEDHMKDTIRIYKLDASKFSVASLAVDHNLFARSASVSECDKVRNKLGLGEKDKYILFVSALRPYKNAETLITVFARLVKEFGIPHYLVIVGGLPPQFADYGAALKKQTVDMNIEGKVIFSGSVDHKLLPPIYQQAELLAFPTKYEGFGLTILEAMSAKIPVVVSKVTSIPEVAGNAAVLLDPMDVDGWVREIHQIIKDDRYRQDLIARGTARAGSFSWRATANNVKESLDQVWLKHKEHD